MKKMKMVLFGIVLLPLMMITVHAASIPYAWVVGGEKLTGANEQNSAKTATQVKERSDVTLTLNNYNGGQLELTCYGTCVKADFIIELVGDNVIKADDIGIKGLSMDNIQFKGEGKLTIKAPTPIEGASDTNPLVIEPNKKVEQTETTEEVETIGAKEKEEEPLKEEESIAIERPSTTKNNDITLFALGIATGLGAVLVLGLLMKLSTKSKNCVSSPKEESKEDKESKDDSEDNEDKKEPEE
ncbi:MAG: hypothetical protein IKF71_02640 [Bacilli bacterium]|nr:hypothetical protein [Bacilli bacterium]